ncbi:MAG: acyl-CoA ligase (AMP-forming), exosortase A system-associated [Rugosibacter sp.]|nr:acyl-CoA ligase (AMP-forming), exosortase A system-associated [Rugosibacter sp.]
MTRLLLPDLIRNAAQRTPQALALIDGAQKITYAELWQQTEQCARALAALGLMPGERVAVYLEKRLETVLTCFGTAHAGGLFVPINPLLRAEQVSHILQDCNVAILVTSAARLASLEPLLSLYQGAALRQIVVVDDEGVTQTNRCQHWSALLKDAALPLSAVSPTPTFHVMSKGTGSSSQISADKNAVAIFYTSGSTGKPKGVVISHRNFVIGAQSVAHYLDNRPSDRLLAALPLSFDAGFSQLTTAFHVGACVVLHNYLLPRDLLRALTEESITGLTAVPPLYIQLARCDWPAGCAEALRYFATTGGRMPSDTLGRLREKMPHAKPFLMYGLTEAFRSTYLPPEEVDRRPDSIGRAIPHAEVLVLRADGTLCDDNEPGELVHRGALVTLGYWNNPEATAERFKPLPAHIDPTATERAVYSGDTVRRDAEGFLYFVGRRDDMIKTSGYRVSPTEIEEVLYAFELVAECAAFGIPHDTLGEAIHVVVALTANATNETTNETASETASETAPATLLAECRHRLPSYMVPAMITIYPGPLPRNANGKIDRRTLADNLAATLAASAGKTATHQKF